MLKWYITLKTQRLNNMAKMVYGYKDYYFEIIDDRNIVGDGNYSDFVKKCRKLIEVDRAAGLLANQELVIGNSK